ASRARPLPSVRQYHLQPNEHDHRSAAGTGHRAECDAISMILDEAKNIRGAVYIPTSAFTAYQMWRDYDRDITQRDLSYAAKLKLNALRVFLSYEYFLEDRKR